MPVTPPITAENVQQALQEALEAIAAVSGSPTAGVPILVKTLESMSPLKEEGTQLDRLLVDALESKGLCFLIDLPGTSPRDDAENAGVLFNLAPPLSLIANLTKLHATAAATATAKNPYTLITYVLNRLVGRPVTENNRSGQKWHVAPAPFGAPVEIRAGWKFALNVTLPATLTRTP